MKMIVEKRMNDTNMKSNKHLEVKDFDVLNIDNIKSHIYEIRGCRVMLDNDIASYFGVETKSLNRAMKRNINRFPESFCFQLDRDEYRNILRCQIGTLELGQGKYSKYQPYVYTEQGIAMLTSCLHTERAIAASIQIIQAFVEMTHYLQQSKQLIPYRELYLLTNRQEKIEADVINMKNSMVTKDDLSDLMKLFSSGMTSEEILILDGQPFKADLAYQEIYKKAHKSVIVIDDYIGIKTLHHLVIIKENIKIIIISDNKSRNLRLAQYHDFIVEYPNRNITFIKTDGRVHDRYIVLDHDTDHMKMYLCGSSSKDSGKRITTIIQISDVSEYKGMIQSLLSNSPLILN